jgi:predicted Zn-ribbon and HTH transcriptional regulator
MSVTKCGKCGAVLRAAIDAESTCPQCGRELSEIHVLVDEEVSRTLRENLI